MIKFAAIVLSLPTMWGAGAAPRDAAPALQSLSETELRLLLQDVFVTPLFPGGVVSSDQGVERFMADGSYVRYFHRASAEGSFAIVGDVVCVRRERRPIPCRRIFRDQQGRLFISGSDISSAPFVRIEMRSAI